MLNPLRAYVVARDGMYEWWPVGGSGHSTGETDFLFSWPHGYSQFDAIRRGSMQTSHDGLTYIAGCQRNSDGRWGGFRCQLTTGSFGPFIPTPYLRPDDANRRLAGTSGGGVYGWFDAGKARQHWYNAIMGTDAGLTPGNVISHQDCCVVDGVEYAAGHRNESYNLWDIAAQRAISKGTWPGANPQHTSCRNWKDTFENHGPTGGSTSGLRYAIWTRSGPNRGHPRGIMGVRLGANDDGVIRYICNHRSVRNSNANECHPNVSPDVEYIVFNSNWQEPGLSANGDVHPYIAVIPDAWFSPHNDGS
jgi:hypothetical protein